MSGPLTTAAHGSSQTGRAWQAGLLIGAALGIAGGYFGRRAERAGRQGLVDWPRAQAIAGGRLRRAPGSLAASEIAAAGEAYAAIMARIVPALEARLGQPLPGVVERHAAVDRAGWVAASSVTFQALVARLESPIMAEMRGRRGALAGFASLANRFVTTQQIGFLLGYLGTRVLGQYDVALLAAEEQPGRLLFVEENIRQTAAQIGVPVEEMRLWIALHETTHAFEFETHPWLRPYLAERLERQLSGFLEEAEGWRAEGWGRLVRRAGLARRGDLISALLSPEQQRLLAETQLVMSLLEGFSDWIMDDVGRALLPDVGRVRERFEARRATPRRGLDRLVARLIGLDLKLEQYRRGEAFVAGVHAAGGEVALAHLWDGPEALPRAAELDHPAAWVQRVVGA